MSISVFWLEGIGELGRRVYKDKCFTCPIWQGVWQ